MKAASGGVGQCPAAAGEGLGALPRGCRGPGVSSSQPLCRAHSTSRWRCRGSDTLCSLMRPPSHARVLAPAAQTKRQMDVLLSGCICGIPEQDSNNASFLTALPRASRASFCLKREVLACRILPQPPRDAGSEQSAFPCPVYPFSPGLWSTSALCHGWTVSGGSLQGSPHFGQGDSSSHSVVEICPRAALLPFWFHLPTDAHFNWADPPVTDFCVSILGFLIPACSHLDLPLQEDFHTLLFVWG